MPTSNLAVGCDQASPVGDPSVVPSRLQQDATSGCPPASPPDFPSNGFSGPCSQAKVIRDERQFLGTVDGSKESNPPELGGMEPNETILSSQVIPVAHCDHATGKN